MACKGWTYLDFRRRIVFLYTSDSEKCYVVSNSISANIVHHKIFVQNFVSQGLQSCTFKEFKRYATFNGRCKAAYDYGVLQLNQNVFNLLLEHSDRDFNFCSTIQKMSKLIYDLEKENQKLKEVIERDKTEPERIFQNLIEFVNYLKK
jgi:hypothetical protein